MLSLEQTFDDRDEWRLLADELSLLPGMTDTGRLGFAIQLKSRQVQGHSPESLSDFPSGIVHTIAGQIRCTSVFLENYPFQGRQAQRHRQHIRRYLGVRLPRNASGVLRHSMGNSNRWCWNALMLEQALVLLPENLAPRGRL